LPDNRQAKTFFPKNGEGRFLSVFTWAGD